LRITLRGVSAGTDDQLGSALIESQDKKTERYNVGDNLPGNAKLHAVMPDRVVIIRGGAFENLYFPEETEGGSGSIGFYNPEPDSYQDSAYEEPQYEEPQIEEPQMQEMQAPEVEYQDSSQPFQQEAGNEGGDSTPPVSSISEERKEEIRRKLDELRQRMKTK
jgi:general secretion pathway protein C